MKFENKAKLYEFLNKLQITFLGSGSQGQCFLDKKTKMVYKIFHDFFDEEYDCGHSKENVLRFSKILNKTYIWPSDTILVGNQIVGYITFYKKGMNLCGIDPLKINLFQLVEDLEIAYKDSEIISKNDVVTYDVMYNILYGKDGISIVDTDDYNFNVFGKSHDEILKINNRNINFAFKVFIIDNYFNEFINQFCELREMYEDLDLDSRIFIMAFQKKISELLDFELKLLKDATNFKNKRRIKEKDLKMIRLLY